MAKRTKKNSDGAITSQEDELLTQSEAARRLGTTPQTMGRWIAQGLFEAIRMPSGLHKVRSSQVDKVLNASSLRETRNPEP